MVIADRNTSSVDNKKWFNRIDNVVDVPNLLEIQTESFEWLKGPGIVELIEEIFHSNPKITVKKIAPTPRVGLVNGLYATASGLGGITIIESFKTPSESKLSLELTGQQGDVMKESMKVAKTVAWNLIPNIIKKRIYKERFSV